MPKIIDAEKLPMYVVNYRRGVPTRVVYEDDIRAASTVDAVQVVRCKDCAVRGTNDCAMYYQSLDNNEQYTWENDNDFCSWGQRKEGD